MQSQLEKKLLSLMSGYTEIVVCCIGTDLISADCLGPLVGQFLIESNIKAYVYGNILSPITALNVDEFNDFIKDRHKNSLVIAVDSAIGVKEGSISVKKGGLIPAAFSKNSKKRIGDISVTAVVSSISPLDNRFKNIRIGQIYKLAKSIAELIENCIVQSLYTKNSVFAIG